MSDNDLRHAKVGLHLAGAKNVSFVGNIRSVTFGVKFYPHNGMKTVGSKIKAGLFATNGESISVGLDEHENNGGASPINRFCTVKSEMKAGLYVRSSSTTDSRLRVGSTNVYKHYVGNQRKSDNTGCGF